MLKAVLLAASTSGSEVERHVSKVPTATSIPTDATHTLWEGKKLKKTRVRCCR